MSNVIQFPNKPLKDKLEESMDSMRDLFGMSKENAHDALQDVKDTANLMIGFMKLYRRVAPKIKFEKAFADGNLHI